MAAAPAKSSHNIFSLAAASPFCAGRAVSPVKLIEEKDSCDGDKGGEVGGWCCAAGDGLES